MDVKGFINIMTTITFALILFSVVRLEAQSTDVIDDRVERLEKDLKEIREQLNEERTARKELESQRAEEKRRHFQSRQLAEGTEIAFFAHVQNSIPHQGAGQIIRFDQVITNVDSTNSAAGYSAVTGVFTAPVDGLYVFSTTLMTHEDHTSHYMIYKENASVCTLFVDGSNGHQYDSASCNVVLVLTKGQSVSVRHFETIDHALEGAYNGGQSTFSGFLLTQHYPASPIVG
ncbi:complement C1q-like protein 4 [Dreissena polymorpha]|uniref:C1q domain-containing protein n=1 Tax=Dreissena polymorpha TaxID=45954 RepID=A0A9D4FUY4_DREPO|nr:complement C1q-like protein 4 [Dreissena polymorpha]KAH3805779.1 hypothetical protein DPMN_134087 [Dreissena polymorpha]